MKHTTNNKSSNLRIVGRGVAQLRNGESAEAGISSTLINMRERESALEVVGRPRQLQQLTPGDRVLLVDGDRTLVLRDGKVVWSDMVVLDTSATVIAAHKVGNLLVVVTSEGNVVMRRSLLGYDIINIADALPQVHLAAVETSTLTTTVTPFEFNAPYSTWQAPLASVDVDALTRLVRNALTSMRSNAMAQGRFTGVMLARYGVRLWDDSYLWLSQPVMVGHDMISTDYRSVATVATASGKFTGVDSFDLSLSSYRLGITMASGIAIEWRDMVKAVDVLISPVAQPFDSATIDYRCTVTTSSGTRRYLLEVGPKPREASAMLPAIIKGDWRVVASTTTLDGSAFSAVNTVMTSQQVVPGKRCDVVKAQLPSSRVITADYCAQVMQGSTFKEVSTVSMEHNGRLYQAPSAQCISNPWPVLPWLDGTLSSGTASATVQVTLATGDGDVTLTTSSACPCSTAELNPFIAFPDPRATHVVIAVGDKRWEGDLAPIEGTGMAAYISPSLHRNTMINGSHPSGGTGTAILPVDGVVVVSAVGNPLATQWRATVSGCHILALGAACRPIYSGGFGRYPIYVFTTQGIMALPQSTSGSYGEPRLITETVIAGDSRPVAGGDALWFISQHGILCRLSGSTLERMLRGLDTATAMAWNDRERELWLVSNSNVRVLMPSGRTYDRDLPVGSIYSDPMHALAVAADGKLLDISSEEPDEMFFSFLSHPFEVSPFMMQRPMMISWNLFPSAPQLPSAGANVTLTLLGERGSSCHGYLISRVTATGIISAPLSRPILAPPTRTLRIEGSGILPTGSLLLPTHIITSM
ncbi:MAG: hypothetical protein IJG81_02475 [Muribaculaceae bacterium]|nr:hypothetical protein [Muribaculaceae bacterium]